MRRPKECADQHKQIAVLDGERFRDREQIQADDPDQSRRARSTRRCDDRERAPSAGRGDMYKAVMNPALPAVVYTTPICWSDVAINNTNPAAMPPSRIVLRLAVVDVALRFHNHTRDQRQKANCKAHGVESEWWDKFHSFALCDERKTPNDRRNQQKRARLHSCSNTEPSAPGGVPRNDCQILRDMGEPLKNRSIASLLTISSATIINAKGAV